MLPLLCLFPLAIAAAPTVSDLDALRLAVADAQPGDVITLSPGTYVLNQTLSLQAPGQAEAPIRLIAEGATLESAVVEAIKVSGPHWQIEGLRLVGVCERDDDCEHAIHVVGAADGFTLRGSTLVDFNAQIKGNGEEVDGVRVWPDDVVIEGNDLYDTRPRQTANPVTKIDVVGGQRWRVEANRIADFEKALGDTVSYAAFFKGNSKDGRFLRNLVRCAQTFEGGARVGLSLGGGGTSPDSICEDGTCTPEHQRGRIENNLIVGCSDVGVYLNKAADSLILTNTLYATSGIDVRFEASSATLIGNVMDGRIRERDGGTATLGTNWTELDLTSVFVDPAGMDFALASDPGLVDALTPVEGLERDFCGAARDDAPDGGAFEYGAGALCDATRAHPDGSEPEGEGGDTDAVDTAGDSISAEGGGKEGGCGCASGGMGAGWLLAAVLAGARRRAPRARRG
jgi:hypothetical protein